MVSELSHVLYAVIGLLAPVYGWLTEGFETADLKAAHELLDALAASAPVQIAG